VDPFLGEVDVKKFSGTDEAGSNTDLAGMTCDAFAHFSLYDSGGTLVLVDIQGETNIFSRLRVMNSFFKNPRHTWDHSVERRELYRLKTHHLV